MTRTLEQIKDTFLPYSDGVRIILLVHRSKEGGAGRKIQRTNLRKVITKNSEEFFQIVGEMQDFMSKDDRTLRIYSTVNGRNINKAVRKFKQEMLDNDYNPDRIKEKFYLDIKNKWVGCLMSSSAKAESSFLLDLDGCDDRSFHSIYNLVEKLTRIQTYYQTKNGYHIITDPFNHTKLDKDMITVLPDGLLLLDY